MKIYQNFDLTDYNSYRVKSACSEAYFPESEDDIAALFTKRKDYVFIGSGHNIILSKEFYDIPFVILNGNYNKIEVDKINNILNAQAGANMIDLCETALSSNLGGVEIFYDIPSSVGGAVVMNAGASGEEFKDLVIKVRYLDLKTLEIKEIYNKDIGFEYRNSLFQNNKNFIVLEAWLQLHRKNSDDIKFKMNAIKAQRHSKQPKEYPNAGSVFKRPDGYFVGPMIEELGLKGFSVGGAKVSKKHGGFIVNFNNATGRDILSVVEEVQNRVLERYNINLELEQIVI